MVVCGEAEDLQGGLAKIEQLTPDVAVIDISLKDSNGIDLVRELRQRRPALPLLVLSMHNEAVYVERVLQAGALGYVTKGESGERVIQGIRQVLKGEVFVSEAMAARMLGRVVGKRDISSAPSVSDLSDRETEVFRMIGNGLPTRQIAEKLGLSVKTVETYRENIKRKLLLADSGELLTHAIQWVQSGGDVG